MMGKNINIELSGVVILAGGESSRMGSPKALLRLPSGQTLLDFHIENAKMLNVPILIADNGKNFVTAKFAPTVTSIADFIPTTTVENGKTGNGALTAIAAAMRYLQGKNVAENGYLLVISCDSLLSADKVFTGLENGKNADMIYFKHEKDYPLLGLYHLDLLPHLIDYLENGNRAVMKFLASVKYATVNLPKEGVNLANFNTIDEFELALKNL